MSGKHLEKSNLFQGAHLKLSVSKYCLFHNLLSAVWIEGLKEAPYQILQA